MFDRCLSRCAGTWRWAVILFALSIVSGCASSLSAQVTRYQDWPADAAGEHYRILPSETQRGTLPFSTYSDMVRAAIGPTGLVEAQGTVAPRFDITLDYGSTVERRWARRSVDPYYGAGYGAGFGYYQPFGGGFYPWGGWMAQPYYEDVPVDVYKNELTVIIRDRAKKGAEVYRATAVSMSQSDRLASVMPYLARAVFDQFPGRNGQVIEVKYDLPR
jgi:hypothetical protein